MNTLDTFFQWLLATSLRASVLALVVLGLQLALGRWLPARWRHALWLPVVLVLLAPMLPASRFSMENRFLAEPVSTQAVAVMPQSFAEIPTLTQSTSWQPSGLQLIFAAWLLGACGVLFVGGLGYRRSLRRIAREKVATSAEIHELVVRAAQQLGAKQLPCVVMSSAVDSPAVAGLLRPVLLLPASFPEGFSANEARMVLLHELTHLKRHDLPLNWLLCVLQALHWFNPLLWLAFARMRADRETACDAQVLGTDAEDRRADYGHALLKLQNSVSNSGLSLAFVGIFERAGMRSRIRAIAMHRRSHPVWGFAAALMIAALTVVGATRAQDTKADKPKDDASKVEKAAPAPDNIDQKDKFGWGRFVSFKDGTLKVKGNEGGLVWHDIPAQTKVSNWDNATNAYQPAGTTEVLSRVEAGSLIVVSDKKALIRVGARRGRTTGTFISYKEDRLLMLGKDLSPIFTKKYGNQLHFHKFAKDVPVYESIDGGDYTLVGTPATTLPNVKEGTVLVVHGEGDDNITRIDIGAPKK